MYVSLYLDNSDLHLKKIYFVFTRNVSLHQEVVAALSALLLNWPWHSTSIPLQSSIIFIVGLHVMQVFLETDRNIVFL